MHNRSICFPHFNGDQKSEAANRHMTDLSLMHLRDTDNWLSNTTRPIGANYRPTNKWSRASADAITSQVGRRYRHVGGILILEWTSRCLVLGVQNRILEVWRMPLILNFGVRRRFQDVIYAVRWLNGSPALHYSTLPHSFPDPLLPSPIISYHPIPSFYPSADIPYSPISPPPSL